MGGRSGNSSANGGVDVRGTARVGGTLSVYTGRITDPDGMEDSEFTYQWLRSEGTYNTSIEGATGSTYVPVAADEGTSIKVRVGFTDDAGYYESFTSGGTAPVAAAPVSLFTASTHDTPESHDGSAAFTFELRFSEAPADGVTDSTLEDHALAVIGGTVTDVRQLETGKNLRWEITVQPSGNEEVIVTLPPTIDCAAQGAICTGDGRMLSVALAILVPGPQNAPTITGTARVGETLTASTTGITDSDGLTNATFTYQWLADDAAISGATGSTYMLVAADVGKAIKVQVSFTDDAGNAESLTSAATTAAALPPLTASAHDVPASHDGSAAFTFELHFSETPNDGFSYKTLRDHAFTATGGEVVKARRLERGKNVRWEITVQPSGNAGVTVALPATTDCSSQGAICTGDGRKLSSALEVTVPGPEASSQLSQQQNSAATGAPAITGTARVGETLTANTTGIADSDGLTRATFAYQWLADDADITDATGSTYTPAAIDAGKAVKVRVTFTDDAGNEESLTSAATSAVEAAAQATQLTASAHGVPASHDGSAAFTFRLHFSETPADGFSYRTLRDHAFTVMGGEVVKARRLEQGKNVRWEITVRPDGNGTVTIVLPVTTDCTDDGAICTEDGRKLSSRLELTVSGPGG